VAAQEREKEGTEDVDQQGDGECAGMKEVASREFGEAHSAQGTQRTTQRDGENAEGGHTGRL